MLTTAPTVDVESPTKVTTPAPKIESPTKITTRELSFSSSPSKDSKKLRKPLLVQPKAKEYFIVARSLLFQGAFERPFERSLFFAGEVANALFGAEPKARPPPIYRPFIQTPQELTDQVATAVAIAKEKPTAGPPTREPNMGGQVRLVARVITDERFTAAEADASLKGLELEVGDKDVTVPLPSTYAAWLEAPSGLDKNAEPFTPAPKEGVVLREGLEEAKLDTLDAERSWASLVSREDAGSWALGWTCEESERDVHAYMPHDIIRDRALAGENKDGGFDTGVILFEDRVTVVLYDVALPLRETGLIERDAVTDAQLKIAEARHAKWGAQLAPEAVRAKRMAKLGKRFGGATVPPAFFREYVRVDDRTPRSDKAADAAVWAALSAVGAPYVILPVGEGPFGKTWPAPVWGVCPTYEKRHGPPPTKHVAKIARSDWRAKPAALPHPYPVAAVAEHGSFLRSMASSLFRSI